jgi:hypothetical protein
MKTYLELLAQAKEIHKREVEEVSKAIEDAVAVAISNSMLLDGTLSKGDISFIISLRGPIGNSLAVTIVKRWVGDSNVEWNYCDGDAIRITIKRGSIK